MRQEHLPPGVHGPSLRWYRPSGMAYWLARSAVRFWITGRPVLGRGDNATFLHDATVDHRGGPVPKYSRARWRRLAWRWGLAGVPWLLADAWLLLGPLYGWLLLGYAVAAGGAGGWAGYRAMAAWWPQRETRTEFVFPVWQVTAAILGERYSRRRAVRAVELQQDPLSARIHLPVVALDDGTKKRIVTAAAERLGIVDASAVWTIRGPHASVELTPRALPPTALVYAEVRKMVADASTSKPFAGLAAGRVPVYIDLDNDGPHMGVSAGSGAGKSTLLRLVLAKRVHDGVGLVVCDYKVISHKWARRIAQEDPNRVRYAMDVSDISDAIEDVFGAFVQRREILKTDPEALEGFREIDLLVEELNSLAAMLRKWWAGERRQQIQEAKDNGETPPFLPVVPPAVDALGVLVQAGRELKIHVHMAAQRLDASAISARDGGAIRESLSNRLLARYTKKAWTMLCDGTPFVAFPGGPRGIWTMVQGDDVVFFRVPLMTDDEAWSLAMSGEAPTGPLLGRVSIEPARPALRLVTLGEAWELIPGCPSLDALRKAVQRADVPALGRVGNAMQYDMQALLALYGRVLDHA